MNGESKQTLPVVLSLAAAAGPHAAWLPFWIIGWVAVLWGYAVQIDRRGWPTPGPAARQALTIAGVLGVLLTFRLALNREACVGLLAVLGALKPLEMKTYRDRMVTAFLAYFLVLTHLLFADSLGMALYMVLVVFINTAVVIGLNDPDSDFRTHLQVAGRIMIQAAPLTLVLFFLFPRVQGSLFGISRDSTGTVGFAETLSPGDITQIVKTDAVAFRATFHGPLPKPDQRYWRGVVFWHFNGETWSRADRIPFFRNPPGGTGILQYTLSLEPHGKKWRFALDIPVSAPPGVWMFDDFSLRSRRNLDQRTTYEMRSATVYPSGPLKPWERIGLELPVSGNPKAWAMARKWADTADTPESVLALALAYFRQNDFGYSLAPPPLRAEDRIDDFLFRTRKGYCEHFASAFAYLMRAAGIPARVVAGYLGGEENPYGNYLIVRQSDAHAWVEAWLPSRGWTRVDPTSAVAPRRVEQGPAAAIGPDGRRSYLDLPVLQPVLDFWKRIRLGWDAANLYWNLWVIGYDRPHRSSLLEGLATRYGLWIGLLMICGCLAAFPLVARRRRPPRSPKDPVQQVYLRFCRKLARAGIPKMPGQGPVDYAQEVMRKRQDLAPAVRQITGHYVALRYGRRPQTGARKIFERLVAGFDPKSGGSASLPGAKKGKCPM